MALDDFWEVDGMAVERWRLERNPFFVRWSPRPLRERGDNKHNEPRFACKWMEKLIGKEGERERKERERKKWKGKGVTLPWWETVYPSDWEIRVPAKETCGLWREKGDVGTKPRREGVSVFLERRQRVRPREKEGFEGSVSVSNPRGRGR
jgi:hypothetical protein